MGVEIITDHKTDFKNSMKYTEYKFVQQAFYRDSLWLARTRGV